MKLHRPQAFAGFLIVSLIALVGFAAFSATGVRAAPPVEIPRDATSRVAGQLLAVDLGPDAPAAELAPPSVEAEPEAAAGEAATEETAPDAAPAPASPATSEAPATRTTRAPSTTTRPPTTTTTTTTTTSPPPTTTNPPPPTTSPPPTTTTFPPGVTFGVRDVEEWRPLVEDSFPPELIEQALSVMECESQGNPLAQHPVTQAAGLFQFIPSTWAWASTEAGWGDTSPFLPEANVAAAAWLVNVSVETEHPRGPWAHWSCQPDVPAE